MDAAELLERVREGGLLTGPEPVVAMVSGGRDSCCLLDVAVALGGPADVGAVHVNYGLRDESDADEDHCARECERLGVELKVFRVSSEQADGNLQAWARDTRYSAAESVARDRGGLLATGHTSTDQAETILYRLAASPGRRALLGMPAREGRLVRPLLCVSREDTTAYCAERGISFREDASNADERFARTRVREGLLPALAAVHPAAAANVARTALLLREETELLDALVDAELPRGAATIAVERLAEMPAALARLVLVRLAEEAVGDFVPQAGDRVDEIVALGRRGGRAELHVGGRAGAVIERGVVRFVLLRERGADPAGGGG